MLSACLRMTRDHRMNLLTYLGFPTLDYAFIEIIEPKVWIGSSKIREWRRIS